MVLPPGNEGSDGPEPRTSTPSGPAGERRGRHGAGEVAGPPARRGVAALGAVACLRPPLRHRRRHRAGRGAVRALLGLVHRAGGAHPEPVVRRRADPPAGFPPPGAHPRVHGHCRRGIRAVAGDAVPPWPTPPSWSRSTRSPAECDWLAVVVAAAVILEIGVILATVHWTPVGNYSKSLIFLTGMASAALLAGVVVRALRSQFDWWASGPQRLEFERDQQPSWPRPQSGPALPGRCMTSSRTTSKSW